jgi:hypothetical protein
MSDVSSSLFTVPCLTCAGWTEHQLNSDELMQLKVLQEAEKKTIRSIRTAESEKDDDAVETAEKEWRDALRIVSEYRKVLDDKYGASCVKCEPSRVSGQVCIISELGLMEQLTALGNASSDLNLIDKPVEQKYPELTYFEKLLGKELHESGRAFPGSVFP